MLMFENYPAGLSDKELNEAMQGYAKLLIDERSNPRSVERYAPLIHLGLAERDARFMRTSGRRTYRVAWLSLLVSLVALSVAFWANRSNSEYDARDLALLERIANQLEVGPAE